LGWEVLGKGPRDKAFELTVGRMHKEVEASSDGKAEGVLAFREEKFGEGVSVVDGQDGARKAMPGSTNADGAEFVKVVFIFVESEKVAEGKWCGNTGWYVIVEEQTEDFGKGSEAGVQCGLAGRGEAVRLEGVGKSAKGAVGCTRFEGYLCSEYYLGSYQDTCLVAQWHVMVRFP
jgi:hypothetical protein